ncbi:MAG: hypothetical protein ACO4CI_11530, partial [Phycisphaerales bacterium]
MIPPPTTDAAIDVPEPLCRAAIAIALLVAGVVGARPGLASITLAENGVSEHRIVIPVEATAVERVAADRLAYYLEGITGAELPILEASEFDGLGPAIFVGLSQPALDRLGGDPRTDLAPQEPVDVERPRGVVSVHTGQRVEVNTVPPQRLRSRENRVEG